MHPPFLQAKLDERDRKDHRKQRPGHAGRVAHASGSERRLLTICSMTTLAPMRAKRSGISHAWSNIWNEPISDVIRREKRPVGVNQWQGDMPQTLPRAAPSILAAS